jgi:hypothetical protein
MIPVFEGKDICNYRPIANLCSVSKIFEKCILKRILDIQGVEITSVNQHGLKKPVPQPSLPLYSHILPGQWTIRTMP